MNRSSLAVAVALFTLLALALGDEAAKKPAAEKAVTVKGYVLDSACAFTNSMTPARSNRSIATGADSIMTRNGCSTR